MDKATERKVERMVRRCMNHLKKKDYELQITKADVDRAVRLTKVVDKNFLGATYGGSHVIQINMGYWQISSKRRRFKEYDSYKKCPVIGSRSVGNIDEILWLIVAHEVSHHVQRSKGYRVGWLKKIHQKPHGEGFRTIYALVRSGLINPMLDASAEARLPSIGESYEMDFGIAA